VIALFAFLDRLFRALAFDGQDFELLPLFSTSPRRDISSVSSGLTSIAFPVLST
jgi:hypothetical protein